MTTVIRNIVPRSLRDVRQGLARSVAPLQREHVADIFSAMGSPVDSIENNVRSIGLMETLLKVIETRGRGLAVSAGKPSKAH